MFIIDFYTLQTIYSLYFLNHVILNGTYSFNLQNIMWIYRTFCQFITCFKYLSILNLNTGAIRNQVSLGVSIFVVCNNDFTFLLSIFNGSNTFDFCDNRKTFWLSCFKKLLDTRKTLCNISTGNTTVMEGTHGQLCTRFTDRLSSNDTYRFTNLYCFTCCHVCTIAFCADTNMTFTGKNGTDFYCIVASSICFYTVIYDSCSTFWCNHMICFYDYFTIFIFNCLTGETACDTFLKTFDFFSSIHEGFYPHTRNFVSVFTTVNFTND